MIFTFNTKPRNYEAVITLQNRNGSLSKLDVSSLGKLFVNFDIVTWVKSVVTNANVDRSIDVHKSRVLRNLVG